MTFRISDFGLKKGCELMYVAYVAQPPSAAKGRSTVNDWDRRD